MKIITFIILIYSTSFVYGQNLVQNHSFEMYTECPTNFTFFNALNWEHIANHAGNADYFHSCSPSSIYSVPTNTRGTQEASEGNAYGGILVYNATMDAREYIQTQLTEPLIGNQIYEISIFVSLAENSISGINRLGARITNAPLSGNGNFNHISGFSEISSQQVITDTANWTEIKGDYIAQGGEEFLTIGNFYSNEDTTASSMNNSSGNISYYYIDSVSVTNKSLSVEDITLTNAFKVFPNPFLSHLNFKFDNIHTIEKVEIFSPINKIITLNKIPKSLDLSALKSGIYFIKVTNKNSEEFIKKIIKI